MHAHKACHFKNKNAHIRSHARIQTRVHKHKHVTCNHTLSYTSNQVFGDIPSDCTPVFGDQRIPAVSSTLTTLSETSYIMTVASPSLETYGRIPISLTCRSVVEAYVTYQPPPRVRSLATQVCISACFLHTFTSSVFRTVNPCSHHFSE